MGSVCGVQAMLSFARRVVAVAVAAACLWHTSAQQPATSCIGPSVGSTGDALATADCPADGSTALASQFDAYGNLFYIATASRAGRVARTIEYNSVVRIVRPGGYCTRAIGSAERFHESVLPTGGYAAPCAGLFNPLALVTEPSATANDVCLNQPSNLAIDAATGDVVLSDSFNHRVVRLVVATGALTTIAGSGRGYDASLQSVNCTGQPGSSGESVAATSACLNLPTGVASDAASGDMYFVDSGNGFVRRISASSGILVTLVGSGCAPGRAPLLSTSWAETCFSLPTFPAPPAPPTPGAMSIALYGGGGGFVVADGGLDRVLHFLPPAGGAAGVAVTITGAGFSQPRGVYAPPTGGVLVSDLPLLDAVTRSHSARVTLLTPAASPPWPSAVVSETFMPWTSFWFIVAPALGAPPPPSVASSCNASSRGAFTFLETVLMAPSIDVVSSKGAVCGSTDVPHPSDTFGGDGGPSQAANLNLPSGLAFGPDGTMYVADSGNDRVRRVLANGTIVTFAGGGKGGDGGAATSAVLTNPTSVSASPLSGDVYIAQAWSQDGKALVPVSTIRVVRDGTIATVLGGLPYVAESNGSPPTCAPAVGVTTAPAAGVCIPSVLSVAASPSSASVLYFSTSTADAGGRGEWVFFYDRATGLFTILAGADGAACANPLAVGDRGMLAQNADALWTPLVARTACLSAPTGLVASRATGRSVTGDVVTFVDSGDWRVRRVSNYSLSTGPNTGTRNAWIDTIAGTPGSDNDDDDYQDQGTLTPQTASALQTSLYTGPASGLAVDTAMGQVYLRCALAGEAGEH